MLLKRAIKQAGRAAYLGQHSKEKVFEIVGDLGLCREAQGFMLHHLEQLEDGWRIEGDAPKHKGV